MAIIYDETVKGSGPPSDYYTLDATKFWLTHYGNQLYLTAISRKPKNFAEKQQAEKELTICARKLTYWERHPNWSSADAAKGAEKLKTMWAQAA